MNIISVRSRESFLIKLPQLDKTVYDKEKKSLLRELLLEISNHPPQRNVLQLIIDQGFGKWKLKMPLEGYLVECAVIL